jgi:hypothetical protein
LAECLIALASSDGERAVAPELLESFCFDRSVETALHVYSRLRAR